MTEQPILIALCGLPGSGKSEVQKIMHRDFNIMPFDDGDIGRRHCMELFGLSRDDVTTQEGKRGHTEIQGKVWENRKIVGEYLAALESVFGPNVVPEWALNTIYADWTKQEHPAHIGYSFGSVRRSQASVYRRKEGAVIEIIRPGIAPTGNVWDLYDKSFVTETIMNDGDLNRLAYEIDRVVKKVVGDHRNTQKEAA